MIDCILLAYVGPPPSDRVLPSRPVTPVEGSIVSALPQEPEPCVGDQFVLFRVVELGPPEESGPAVDGWRSAVLAQLPAAPPRTPVGSDGIAAAPVLVARPPVARSITEAQARGLAAAAARAVLEVLAGRRPVQQLTGLFGDRAMVTVQTLCRGGLRWPVRGATLGRVHVYLPSRNAVEACVLFHCDERCRALALRFERTGRRWICAAVRVG